MQSLLSFARILVLLILGMQSVVVFAVQPLPGNWQSENERPRRVASAAESGEAGEERTGVTVRRRRKHGVVRRGATATVKGVGRGAKAVGKGTAVGAKAVGRTTADTAVAVGSGTADGTKYVAGKTAAGAKATGRGAKAVGRGTKGVGKAVVGAFK
jgi:hypothetical protein